MARPCSRAPWKVKRENRAKEESRRDKPQTLAGNNNKICCHLTSVLTAVVDTHAQQRGEKSWAAATHQQSERGQRNIKQALFPALLPALRVTCRVRDSPWLGWHESTGKRRPGMWVRAPSFGEARQGPCGSYPCGTTWGRVRCANIALLNTAKPRTISRINRTSNIPRWALWPAGLALHEGRKTTAAELPRRRVGIECN
jgi:hypothetical protein